MSPVLLVFWCWKAFLETKEIKMHASVRTTFFFNESTTRTQFNKPLLHCCTYKWNKCTEYDIYKIVWDSFLMKVSIKRYLLWLYQYGKSPRRSEAQALGIQHFSSPPPIGFQQSKNAFHLQRITIVPIYLERLYTKRNMRESWIPPSVSPPTRSVTYVTAGASSVSVFAPLPPSVTSPFTCIHNTKATRGGAKVKAKDGGKEKRG